MFKFLAFLLDMLVPRYMTIDIVFMEDNGEEIICERRYLAKGEKYYATAKSKFFNLFGFVLFERIYDRKELTGII